MAIQELGVPGEYRTLFAPSSMFQMCSSHTHHTPSISSAGRGLQEIKEQGVNEKKKRTLRFPALESVAHIVLLSQSNETKNRGVYQASADRDCTRNLRAPDMLF